MQIQWRRFYIVTYINNKKVEELYIKKNIRIKSRKRSIVCKIFYEKGASEKKGKNYLNLQKNFFKKEVLFDKNNPSVDKIVNETFIQRAKHNKQYKPSLRDNIKVQIKNIKLNLKKVQFQLISLLSVNIFYLIND